MVRSVTAIAQCDQVGRVIDPTGGTGNQMMNVGFALGACFAAGSANVRVASENDGANGAPLLKLRLGRRKRHSVQLGKMANLRLIALCARCQAQARAIATRLPPASGLSLDLNGPSTACPEHSEGLRALAHAAHHGCP